MTCVAIFLITSNVQRKNIYFFKYVHVGNENCPIDLKESNRIRCTIPASLVGTFPIKIYHEYGIMNVDGETLELNLEFRGMEGQVQSGINGGGDATLIGRGFPKDLSLLDVTLFFFVNV